MKRIRVSAIAAGVAVAATVLAGCSAGSSTEKPSSLELWLPPLATNGQSDKTQWDEILKPFEEEQGVDINVTIVDWGAFEAKFLTGVAGGAGPDVGYMYNEMVGDYIQRDQLIPFDDYLTAEQKDNYLYLPNGQVSGKQYLMPFNVGGARVMLYNKDVLAAAGVEPPTTWDEFTAAAEKISTAGYTPYVAPWGDPSRGVMNAAFFPFLWQAGGNIFNDDASATAFNSPAGVKAAEFVNSLKTDGVMPDTVTGMAGDEANTAFSSGDVAFYINSDDTLPIFEEAGINVGVIPSLSEKEEGTFFNVDSLVMLKACEDPQLCADLVNFMLSDDVEVEVHKFVPAQPIGKGETYSGPEVFKALYSDKADILHALPIASNSVQVYNILYTNLQQMLLGQKTPKQAMEDAAKDGDAALKGN